MRAAGGGCVGLWTETRASQPPKDSSPFGIHVLCYTRPTLTITRCSLPSLRHRVEPRATETPKTNLTCLGIKGESSVSFPPCLAHLFSRRAPCRSAQLVTRLEIPGGHYTWRPLYLVATLPVLATLPAMLNLSPAHLTHLCGSIYLRGSIYLVVIYTCAGVYLKVAIPVILHLAVGSVTCVRITCNNGTSDAQIFTCPTCCYL